MSLRDVHSLALGNESNKSRVDLLCDSFVAAITSAASKTIGIKSYSSSPDWFQENISTIQPLLLQKKLLFLEIKSLLKQDLPVPVSLLNKYRFARNLAKYSICKIQNGWWQRKAEDLNTFRKNGDWRNLFLTCKQLSFKKVARSCSVYDKSGSYLITLIPLKSEIVGKAILMKCLTSPPILLTIVFFLCFHNNLQLNPLPSLLQSLK